MTAPDTDSDADPETATVQVILGASVTLLGFTALIVAIALTEIWPQATMSALTKLQTALFALPWMDLAPTVVPMLFVIALLAFPLSTVSGSSGILTVGILAHSAGTLWASAWIILAPGIPAPGRTYMAIVVVSAFILIPMIGSGAFPASDDMINP